MTTGKNLHKNLEIFLRHIDAIRDTLPMTMLLIQPYNKKANDDFTKFLKENVEEIEDDNGKKRLLVKADESKKFETLERNASTSALASKIIPESLFVSLVSQYDAFLTRLLRAIYEIKPDVLNGSERNLTFSQLVEMETVENARDYIIDKEDWSASSDDFKLAFAVLTDDYETAYEMMIKIGDNGDVDKSDYKQWPLFNKIREEEKFKETYKEIFKEDFSVIETPMKPIQELINKEIKKNKELKEKTVKKVDSAKELKEKESTTPNKSYKQLGTKVKKQRSQPRAKAKPRPNS
jgi:hypothetical protein